jgi:hypothetical protein
MEMTEIKGVTYSVEHYDQFRQTGDLNYFEEIIDMMILDGISGMNDTIRNAIRNLTRDEKRMAILSLLDKDLNLFKRIKALTDKNINKMDHIKDIIMMLREYVKVGEVEKKKFGEVMTPLELVKEMLATLPEEVWSNPNLKWLDPANGTGPYPIMVIYKLMNGLKNYPGLEDDEVRYKHIVENMIYVCELQPKNMFLYMCAVDPFDKYKLNIYTGSFLESGFDKHMKDVWCVDKFDVVIGNPPYQDSTDKSKGTTGKKNLYQQFINKSSSNLVMHGFLLFVNPPGFLKTTVFEKSTDIFKTFQSLNLLYLNLSDINDKYFKVGTPICYFLLQKNDLYKTTNIITNDSSINLDIRNFNFVPRLLFTETYSILEKVSKNGKKFCFKRDSKIVGPNFITMKRLNHINKNGKMNPIVGGDFKYDLTLECEYPEKMCDILNHKIYRFLNYTLRHDGVIYHYFINGLCYPDNYENENNLYNYFGLTESEISLIEKVISD